MKLKSIITIAVITCTPLISPLQAKPATTSAKTSEAIPYPLATCIVSGEKLGEMGKPISVMYKKQIIKLCCKPCLKKFKKSPRKYLKQLRKEEAKQK